MCGIMGYVGEENAADIIIDGLEKLEYRGYDSAGMAVTDCGKLAVKKVVGSPSGLRKFSDGLIGKIGIGHTRWATHGAPTVENAHPHCSMSGLFTVVHNGIIENYAELKAELEADGYIFKSDTDTEVIAHLLEKEYNRDLKGTVSAALTKLKGSYALGILCADYPDIIVCAKLSSPLFAGTSSGGAYLASDASAIASRCDRLYRLGDGEIGILAKDSFKVYDIDGCRIRKSEVKIKSYDGTLDKGGYEHFMLKEIHEQPVAVRRTLSEIIDEKRRIKFKNFKMTVQDAKKIQKISFVACGSAYHVGMVGAYACERFLHINSEACVASEYRYKNPVINENTLVVVISQSGETADTLAALRLAKRSGAKVVSIVNVENSTIAQESDSVIFTRAGKEVAVATTKAYSAQLAVVYALILYLAVKVGTMNRKDCDSYVGELCVLPEKIEQILSDESKFEKLADTVVDSDYICFIGRGFDYCAVAEASLKLKEVSYIPCESYPAGELKHGTISLIDEKSLIIAMCCSDELRTKTVSNINEATARGARSITISDTEDADIQVPKIADIFSVLIEVIPSQLIAYYTAKKRNCEIDKPRNLAKSVTVE
ncbi:MAG: glutamine--fructose-6-phosphate transaminase (isomerizing) [Clostridia bacterium]|nr:glutamine--fructose-6-phosphate transaminase (isomerizing) [Clostridia bacterium]